MPKPEPVLVLASSAAAQFVMLNQIPHIVCGDIDEHLQPLREVTVILQWSGSRALLQKALGQAPNVRWIHSRAAGVDNLLFPELTKSDVVLTNGRGVFSSSLGEFVIAAILYFAKGFRRMIRNQAAGRWEPFDVEEVAGQTVGIVGYGDIGRAAAGRAKAMDMRVLATKRHIPAASDPLVERFYSSQQKREMVAVCDYIVATAPLTNETRHMISDREFASMKSNAVVINVGRGPVIDEAAMLRALTAGRIKGAALDVFEHEPLPPGHPFYGLENVLLSPHCADHTADWQDQAMRFFLEQYDRFRKGEPLQNVVNKQLGY